MTFVSWDVAWQQALYGPQGFYRSADGPAAHFRTSVHAAPDVLAGALLRIAAAAGLHRVVDIGSGRGELLRALRQKAIEAAMGVELVGCDVVTRPFDLTPDVGWVRADGGAALPDSLRPWLSGALVVAHEWLDDVPCPVVERDGRLEWRTVLVDPGTGRERLGPAIDDQQRDWLERWWLTASDPEPGDRAEVGGPRDDAWAALVRSAPGSVLLAIDYAHERGRRPTSGSLAGYRDGRLHEPTPDGTCDVTAHVAVDAVGAAGEAAGAVSTQRTTQRQALRALGVDGRLPPADAAAGDPVGYLHAVSAASRAAELLDPGGLGGFAWLLQSTGPALPRLT
jgi:SAM-dependent MidA family methyltransferase